MLLTWSSGVAIVLRRNVIQLLARETCTASTLFVEATDKEIFSEAICCEELSSSIVRPRYIATDLGIGRFIITFDNSVAVYSERAHLYHSPQNQPRVILIVLNGSNTLDKISGTVQHSEPTVQDITDQSIASLYDSNGYDVQPPFITRLPGPPGSGIPVPEYRNSPLRTDNEDIRVYGLKEAKP